MIIYSTIIAITCLGCHLAYKYNNKILKIITILIPSIFAGIRYGIGTDYLAIYYPYYQSFASNSINIFNGRMEIGYNILNVVIQKLNLGFPFLMFICSFITFYFLVKALEEYKNEISITWGMFFHMILYYQFSFNAVRQAMAMSIFLYAITILNQKKYLKYILFIGIGAMFHRTILIGLIMIPIINFLDDPKKKINRYILYAVMIVLVLNYEKIGILISKFDSIAYYSGYFLSKGEDSFGINYFLKIAMYILPFLLLKKEYRSNKKIFFLFSCLIIGSIFRLFAYLTSTFAERIALYFLIPQVIVIPYCIKNLKNKVIIVPIIVTMFVGMWYYNYFVAEIDQTVPYTTIFSKEGF